MLQDMSEDELLFWNELAYENNDGKTVFAIEQELARRGWAIDYETGTLVAIV